MAKTSKPASTPSPVPDREKGFYWIKDTQAGWDPHGFWDGACWTFPWSSAKYDDDEVGEIGPICRPPEDTTSADRTRNVDASTAPAW